MIFLDARQDYLYHEILTKENGRLISRRNYNMEAPVLILVHPIYIYIYIYIYIISRNAPKKKAVSPVT